MIINQYILLHTSYVIFIFSDNANKMNSEWMDGWMHGRKLILHCFENCK